MTWKVEYLILTIKADNGKITKYREIENILQFFS